MTNGRGKSDSRIVPAKSPNTTRRPRAKSHGDPYTGTKAETPETAKGSPKAIRPWETEGVEEVEESRLAKGNTDRQNAPRTQSRNERARSALDRVRQVAEQSGSERFTALFHHVTVDRLREAFQKLNRKAAPGVDDVTWEQYAGDLENHLQDLHARLHRGAYRAKASRRVSIPKADGRERLLGLASLEDKLVQRAVAEERARCSSSRAVHGRTRTRRASTVGSETNF